MKPHALSRGGEGSEREHHRTRADTCICGMKALVVLEQHSTRGKILLREACILEGGVAVAVISGFSGAIFPLAWAMMVSSFRFADETLIT
jgi:hypothetical protein